jgi:hypothetical protein
MVTLKKLFALESSGREKQLNRIAQQLERGLRRQFAQIISVTRNGWKMRGSSRKESSL